MNFELKESEKKKIPDFCLFLNFFSDHVATLTITLSRVATNFGEKILDFLS